MTDHRSEIVKRVVHSLDETQDPDALVWAHFDDDREAVIEATRQTLQATREYTSDDKVAEVVDRELLELLRYSPTRSRGVVPWMIMHRVGLTWTGSFVALASYLAFLLL